MKVAQGHSISSLDLPPGGLSLAGWASRSLELRHLRYFYTVANAGNFGRAARELNIAQPTVTHQVQKLEEGLDTQLFIRHGRGVTLTPAGVRLLDRLDIIMHLLNAPLEEARVPEQTSGTVSLALPAECTALLVPPLIAQCRARWPKMTLTVREADSASMEEWVIAGRVDVAVLQDCPALDGIEIQPVLSEGLGLVLGMQSPLAHTTGPVRVRDLAGLPMILPHPRHWIRRRVENAWFRRGIRLDQLQQIESIAVTKEMVRNGLGCSVLPSVAVREEVARSTLVFRPIEQMPLFGVHAIARRKVPDEAPVIAEFARSLRDTMSELSGRGLWAGASVVHPTAELAESPAMALS